MNSTKFFSVVRKHLGSLKQSQVDGFNHILSEANRRSTPLWFLAYILATVWWETAKTMQPIEEYGGQKYLRSKKYWPYYGRGLVQLTWDYNYKKAGQILGVDFIKNPDLLLEWKYALPILFIGMEEGWFTGKKLSDYIDNIDEPDKEDLREFSNARRIINGVDRQVEIGEIALVFEEALLEAQYGFKSTEKPVEAPKPVEQGVGSQKGQTSLLELLIAILRRLFNANR